MRKWLVAVCIVVMTGSGIQGFGQQTLDKSFGGWWATTSWLYEFHRNGTYQWNASGHYGYVKRTGRYRMSGDTIYILSGNGNTHGTLGECYILDKDGMLIDLETRYDYKPLSNEPLMHSSKIRNVKYPQIAARDVQQEKDLGVILDVLLNTPVLKQYYHFDRFPSRQLLVAGYGALHDSTSLQVSVEGKPLIFTSEEHLRDEFYILIDDINLNRSDAAVYLKIKGEGVVVKGYFRKENNTWVMVEPPSVHEY